MQSRRVLKVAEAIREVVSMAILADLKDPRIQNVTVTFVEVSGDLRQAKVHVSIMGSETQQKLSLQGLRSSAGYLQGKVAKRIDTRYTPKLAFVLDPGVKKSMQIAQILNEVLPDENDDEVDADEAADTLAVDADDKVPTDEHGELPLDDDEVEDDERE